MSTTEFLKAVDHAAGMNDRWMFIASLVVIGLFGMWVMRYFVKQHERLIEDHRQARECYQESLRGVVAEQSAANAKLMVCLDNNTKVLEECRDELRRPRFGFPTPKISFPRPKVGVPRPKIGFPKKGK